MNIEVTEGSCLKSKIKKKPTFFIVLCNFDLGVGKFLPTYFKSKNPTKKFGS